MSTPIVFLDTETDGVHPDRKVWEVAMIRRDERGERETAFYVGIDLSTADPFGLRVGRFYERHPFGRTLAGHDGPSEDRPVLDPTNAAVQVARMTHGAHLVGAVPNFDAEVLASLLRANHLTPAWHYHLIDVEALAVGYLSARLRDPRTPDVVSESLAVLIAPPWRSDDLSRACGVEPPSEDERHTALGDVRWALRLYDAITGSPQ